MYLAGRDTCSSTDARPTPLFPERPDPRDLGGRPAAVPRRAGSSDPPGPEARPRRRGGERGGARLGDPAPGAGRGRRRGGDARAAGQMGDGLDPAPPPRHRGLAGRGLRRDRPGCRRLSLQGRGVAGDTAGDRGGGARRDGPRPLRPDRHRQGDPPTDARRPPGAQLPRAGDPGAHRRRPDRTTDRPRVAPQHGHGGYQSIHSLQLSTTGESFGNEFRARGEGQPAPAGDFLEPDYAANARSLGCDAVAVETVDELSAALAQARAGSQTTVIACAVEPRRMLLGSGAWWDLGVPQVSDRDEVRRRTAEHAAGARSQRDYV